MTAVRMDSPVTVLLQTICSRKFIIQAQEDMFQIVLCTHAHMCTYTHSRYGYPVADFVSGHLPNNIQSVY